MSELDKRAVSPVIGVLLLVGITVILAGVVGAFALNTFGTTESPPSASFEYEYNDSAVEITHIGGEDIDADQLRVSGDNLSQGASLSGWSGQVSAGETAVVERQSTKDSFGLSIYWRGPSGDSSRLAQTSGGDA